ncbi:MAG: sulfotransferase [Verrucomicrobiota bacterium]
MPKRMVKLIPLLVLIAAFATILLHFGADAITNPGSLTADAKGGIINGAVLFMLVFIIGGSILPSVVFVIAAGVIWPYTQALLISFSAGLAAASLGFLLSRHAAHDFCSRHIPTQLQAYNEGIRTCGLETTITLRLLFFLFPPVNWLLGISRIRARDYLLGTALGCLPGMLLYTYIGQGWIPWLLEDPLPRISLLIATAATIAIAVFTIRRWLKHRRGEADLGPAITLSLFLNTAQRYLTICFTTFFPSHPHRRPTLKRCLIMLAFLPAFALIQLVHWAAFLLDELLFPRYREIPVQAPVFIVGIPRSGTTHLHRVMARDTEHFTTLRLWHVLLAPAICERKLLHLIARLDRCVGRPLARLLSLATAKCTNALEGIHKLSLNQPEEDFVLLMPVLACYILAAPFPQSESIAELGYFDSTIPAKQRSRIMAFYRGMIQRHLYCVGADRTLLSKNVSFTPMLESLLETFPDARVIACIRHPVKTVPSQISSITPAWRAFGNRTDTDLFRQRWINLIHHYCQHLNHILEQPNQTNIQCIRMKSLTQNLDATIQRLYAEFELPFSADFAKRLADEHHAAINHQSRHHYSPADYNLSPEAITQRFADVWPSLEAHT